MAYRQLILRAAALTAALAFAAGFCSAETIAVDTGIAVKEPSVPSPRAGMTMTQVEAKFGPPESKLPAVGKPPIARWGYSGFTVYFEYDHVIHSVATSS